MSRAPRAPTIPPDTRQRLLELSHQIWHESCTAMRLTETKSDDYKAVAKIQAEALAFGEKIAFPDSYWPRCVRIGHSTPGDPKP